MWTSCFNTLLNILITTFVVLGQGDFPLVDGQIKMVAKGDDNFFAVKEDDMVSWVARYQRLGMKVKIFRRDKYQDLEYCSGKFYSIPGGLKWGVKPFRTLAKFGLNLHNHSEKVHKRLLLGTAVSMLPIAGHVPVLGHMFRAIVNDGYRKGVKAKFEYDSYQERITSATVHQVSEQAEDDFMLCYGFTPEEYCKLRDWAVGVTLDSFPCVLVDELFERGYIKDTGENVLDFSNHEGEHWIAESGSVKMGVEDFLSPLLEELARLWLGWAATVGIAFLEVFSSGSVFPLFIHTLLHLLQRRFGFLLALGVHYFFNFLVRN